MLYSLISYHNLICTVQCRIAQHSIERHRIVLYYIVLYCIVLYCTVLYCFVLYCIGLYCIAPLCFPLLCFVLYWTKQYYMFSETCTCATYYDVAHIAMHGEVSWPFLRMMVLGFICSCSYHGVVWHSHGMVWHMVWYCAAWCGMVVWFKLSADQRIKLPTYHLFA